MRIPKSVIAIGSVTLERMVRLFFTRNSDEGATAVEYALIVSLIAGAVVLAVTAFGGSLSTFFSNLPSKLGF